MVEPQNDKKCFKELEILLTEFTAIRTESTYLQQSEASMTTVTFSFIAAILSLNFFFGNDSNNLSTSDHIPQCIILILCPLLIMFFGCMWMDLLYRRIRYGAYLYLVESDINNYIKTKELNIYFEHWIVEQQKDWGFFRKTSRFYGYVVFGTWIIAPVLLYPFSGLLFPDWNLLAPHWNIVELFCEHKVWGTFILIAFVVYLIIMGFFCKEIVDLKNPKNLTYRVSDR